jgi:hypothetical protein
MRRRKPAQLPSPATFLRACAKHRVAFHKMAAYTEQLILVRQNSEDVLHEASDIWIEDIVGEDGWDL